MPLQVAHDYLLLFAFLFSHLTSFPKQFGLFFKISRNTQDKVKYDSITVIHPWKFLGIESSKSIIHEAVTKTMKMLKNFDIAAKYHKKSHMILNMFLYPKTQQLCQMSS